MSFIDTALKLLRRPIASTGEPPRRRRGEPTDTDPASDAELTAALQQLAAERQAAEALLNGAALQREELLALPGTDDQILDLGQSIDRAQLVLERLDRLEPDLIRRRGEIRFNDRNARWVVDRDAAAPAFERFSAAIEAYLAARAEWVEIVGNLCVTWPTAAEVTPRMPRLDATAASYAASLQAFREKVIVLAEPPRPFFGSLAGAIEFARMFGRPPDGIPPEWLVDCDRAVRGEATVQMLVSTLDSEGRQVPKGAVLTLPYADAERAVRAGRAFYREE